MLQGNQVFTGVYYTENVHSKEGCTFVEFMSILIQLRQFIHFNKPLHRLFTTQTGTYIICFFVLTFTITRDPLKIYRQTLPKYMATKIKVFTHLFTCCTSVGSADNLQGISIPQIWLPF